MKSRCKFQVVLRQGLVESSVEGRDEGLWSTPNKNILVVLSCGLSVFLLNLCLKTSSDLLIELKLNSSLQVLEKPKISYQHSHWAPSFAGTGRRSQSASSLPPRTA
jgi:hypothetical protein